MPISRRMALALAFAVAAAPGATASDYPTRPVTVIVAQAAGGTNDLVARFLADRLSQSLGQRFLVENRAGAGGNIGTSSAAQSAPDGYTIFVTASSNLTINPFLYKSVQFDPVRDFEPITVLAKVPYILAAHPSFPASSTRELIDLAKSSAKPVQFGSAGIGTINHLLGEMLNAEAGIKLTHVPYRGAAAMVNDLVAGHLQLGFGSPPAVLPHIETKALKALGQSGAQRVPSYPGIPAMAETLPGYGAELWVGLFAIKGTPPDTVAKLHAESLKAMSDPQTKAKLLAQGAEVVTSTRGELAKLLGDDLAKWRDIIGKNAIKID